MVLKRMKIKFKENSKVINEIRILYTSNILNIMNRNKRELKKKLFDFNETVNSGIPYA